MMMMMIIIVQLFPICPTFLDTQRYSPLCWYNASVYCYKLGRSGFKAGAAIAVMRRKTDIKLDKQWGPGAVKQPQESPS